ncbi:MAG: DEAD/DEAH box helicase [Planctomycetaceae bacterium]|nr:MAG: DEAD/DEAH box helicase [Planctomycetaceae bacterium]
MDQFFHELGLSEPLCRAIAQEGYEHPTPIQAQTIPAALAGKDCLGIAQTGTGKTAAFSLPILDRLKLAGKKAAPGRPLALVLAPTRELAIQIGDSFKTYGRHLPMRCACIFGGVSQVAQVAQLRRGVDILVATPGRLLDLINQRHVSLGDLQYFVLDEADRMLDMGFLPDLKRIIATLPKVRQSLFFSATMPPVIVELTHQLLDSPVVVNVAPKQVSVQKIDQQVLFLDRGERQDILRQLLSLEEVERAIVFTRTKRGASVVGDKLTRAGITAAVIHGNKSQSARQQALEAFRQKRVRVLVATDIAARGLDVDGISHVINFDLPNEPESYVHRIGRTARAGAAGIALSFCTPDEYDSLDAIERLIGRSITSLNARPAAASGLVTRAAPAGRSGRGAPAGGRGRSGRSGNSGSGRTGGSGGFGSKKPRRFAGSGAS